MPNPPENQQRKVGKKRGPEKRRKETTKHTCRKNIVGRKTKAGREGKKKRTVEERRRKKERRQKTKSRKGRESISKRN